MCKFNIRFAICMVILSLMAGCAHMGEKDALICDKPEAANSLICKYVSPTSADFGLLFTNLEAIKNGFYTRAQAEAFLLDAEKMLDGVITYQSLVVWLRGQVDIINQDFAIELIFLSQFLDMPEFNVDVPIDEYDKYLLKAHIANQRNKVLALFP